MRPSPHTHATRGGARDVIHPHGRWARWLGRGALPALCIAIPRCTTAAPAGGAHAGGGVRERLLCAQDPPHTPRTVRHVPYHTRTTSGCAGPAGGRCLRCASPAPHARPRPRLAALMRAGVCGSSRGAFWVGARAERTSYSCSTHMHCSWFAWEGRGLFHAGGLFRQTAGAQLPAIFPGLSVLRRGVGRWLFSKKWAQITPLPFKPLSSVPFLPFLPPPPFQPLPRIPGFTHQHRNIAGRLYHGG